MPQSTWALTWSVLGADKGLLSRAFCSAWGRQSSCDTIQQGWASSLPIRGHSALWPGAGADLKHSIPPSLTMRGTGMRSEGGRRGRLRYLSPTFLPTRSALAGCDLDLSTQSPSFWVSEPPDCTSCHIFSFAALLIIVKNR